MAGGNVPHFNRSYEASGDLTGSYFKAVKMDANGQIAAVAAVEDPVVGILQNKPDAQGQAGTVAVAGTVWIVADGVGVTAGSPAFIAADGSVSDSSATGTATALGVTEQSAAAGKLAAVLVQLPA